MRRYLFVAWVMLGLAAGLGAHAASQPEAARWLFSAAALPVAAHVALGLIRSLMGGRLGVDAIALAAILGAIALG